MPIELQQPGLAGLYGRAAVISKAEQKAQRTQEQQARKQEIQEQRQYQQSMKQVDAQLDLEMYERSKRWEIEKMQLRSQVDFTREEQRRQRVLDQLEASVKYIEESDLFDEQQKERLLFSAKLKAVKADIPGLSQMLFPETPTPRQVTPTQRVLAMKKLREEEAFQEPTWLQRWLPGGKGELSEDVLREKELLESIAAGQYEAPETISTGLPTPTTQAEYNRIPRGSRYVDSKGNIRTKS